MIFEGMLLDDLAMDLQMTYGYIVTVQKETIKTALNSLNSFDVVMCSMKKSIDADFSTEEIVLASEGGVGLTKRDKESSGRGQTTGKVIVQRIRKSFPKMPILIYGSSGKTIPAPDDNMKYLIMPEASETIDKAIQKLMKQETK